MINIIEGIDVDLINPFPLAEIHRIVGWLHCFKSFVTTDDGPQTPDEHQVHMTSFLSQMNVASWGIIDKHQKLNIRHEAPLVGFIAFERISPRNGYFHTATTRKAWGSGMIDEAAALVLRAVFEATPELLRVSTFVVNNNFPAKSLAKRMGFTLEGVFADSVLQSGEPKPVTHFGLTRRKWNEQCQLSPSSPSLQELQVPDSLPLVEVVNKDK